MELNKEEQELRKQIMLKTLNAFQSLCFEHNLIYYAGYGTCLGAIRHKGFIPWDDDIDLLMPRKDYEKLKNIFSYCRGTGYELLYYGGQKGYYLPFMKFCDANTTIWELKRYACVLGVYIDIFPIDETIDEEHASHIFSKYNDYFSRAYEGSIPNYEYDIKCRDFRGIVRKFRHVVFHPFYQNRFLKLEKFAKGESGEYTIVYCGPYRLSSEFCSKSWFGSGEYVEFENTKIRVPQDYHSYLKNLYGDYMTLPPEEKRVSHHNIYYFNLERRLSVNDILKMKIPEEIQKTYTFE